MSGLARTGGNRALLGGDELVRSIGGDGVAQIGGDEPVIDAFFGGDEGAPAFI
jgi:hypothetical protein